MSRLCSGSRRAVFCLCLSSVHTGGLLLVCLENVKGILKEQEGLSVMHMFQTTLETCIPEFIWRVDTLALHQYMCPQTRVRVFLRGIRRVVSSCVPAPLPPWGSRPLREALARDVAPTPREKLSAPQQANLLVRDEIILSSNPVANPKAKLNPINLSPEDLRP